MRAALCGNPNSGKTTLLNRLTGMRQRTGNFPGVTVERVEGALRADPGVTLIDLPGVYALDAAEGEEALARESLRDDRPDAILNVLDATSPIAAEAFAPSAPTMAESMYSMATVVIWVRIAGTLRRQISRACIFHSGKFSFFIRRPFLPRRFG